MMDPTREEQVMKRAAVVLGIAAALAVPATASATNRVADKPQVKPQISRVMVAKPARVSVARVSVQRATAYRIPLKRKAAR
jgi:hypothetical protein